jgi:hypothetical protein
MFITEAMVIQVWFGIVMSTWGLIVVGHDKKQARHKLQKTPLTSPTIEGSGKGEASATMSE